MPPDCRVGKLAAVTRRSQRAFRWRLEHSPLQSGEVELGGVRDLHDCHHPCLHWVRDYQVGRIGDAAGHVEADDEESLRPDLAHRSFDVAAHERPGQLEGRGSRQTSDRTNGIGKRLFTYQRNGVDRDALASDVVSVEVIGKA